MQQSAEDDGLIEIMDASGDRAVEAHFNKLYDFKNSGWSLPPGEVYVEDKWVLEKMQRKKALLNSVKNKLDDFDLAVWSLHTKKRDPSSPIMIAIRNSVQPELHTQAWCKFYETVAKHPKMIPHGVDETLKSLHLCEAPGGFISALNHYLCLYLPKVKLEWTASTLNPSYEGNSLSRMIPDDRLIVYTKKRWMFGADQTGDITKDYNYEDVTTKVLAGGRVHLVTADGSINCMDDPGNQEAHVGHLHYCETMTALTVLEMGGSFMLKIFTMFEESTICLLYLLTCCFAAVRIFKPITSKSGNSETYVLCFDYSGFQSLQEVWPRLIAPYGDARTRGKSMFRLGDVDPDFLRQIEECAEFFMRKQIYTINDNVRNFGSSSSSASFYENVRLRTLHEDITNRFLSLYHVERIENGRKLVPLRHVNRFNKAYQTDEKVNRKRYFIKEKQVPRVELVVGRRVDEVFYSRYTHKHLLESRLRASRGKDDYSLFNLAKSALADRRSVVVVDYESIRSESSQWDFECALLKSIISNLGLDMVFINVPIRSTVLANAFYLLCNGFKHNSFCGRGLVVLSGFDAGKQQEIVDQFAKVRQFINKSDLDDGVYRKGLVEIVDRMSVHFLRCLWFYNNNLLFERSTL